MITERFLFSSPVGLLAISLIEDSLYSVALAQSVSSASKAQAMSSVAKAQAMSSASKAQAVSKDSLCSGVLVSPLQEISIEAKAFRSRVLASKSSVRLSYQARKIHEALSAYFEGALTHFHIPLVRRGTGFQNRLWHKLKNIPYGKTKTYASLACDMGIPKGARAVGQALASNPFLIVVPCHRVVAKEGLGGFALGLKAKKQLLCLEQKTKPFALKKLNL